MKTYVYEQEMNRPTHTKKMRTVNFDTGNRMGKTPPTAATVAVIKPSANTAMKSQPMPTPTAASDTVNLLGLVADGGFMDVID